MVPEAPLEETEHGLVPSGDGWFVLNAREARWRHREGLSGLLFDGDTEFPQVGINLFVLAPGMRMAMYHREADHYAVDLRFDGQVIVNPDSHPQTGDTPAIKPRVIKLAPAKKWKPAAKSKGKK